MSLKAIITIIGTIIDPLDSGIKHSTKKPEKERQGHASKEGKNVCLLLGHNDAGKRTISFFLAGLQTKRDRNTSHISSKGKRTKCI